MKRILLSLSVILLLAASCKEKEVAEEATVTPAAIEVPFEGGIYTVEVKANCRWMIITPSPEQMTIEPSAGEKNATVTITVLPNDTHMNMINEVCVLSEKTNEDLAIITVDQKAAEVIWGDVTYPVVKMADGRYWFARNLQYVPEGMTVSEDPAKNDAGIWYPNYGGTTAKTDADSVAKYGYLYNGYTALGITPDKVTADNLKSFEGEQGICPEGWHIPTHAESEALIQAYWDEGQKGAPIKALEEAGFNPLPGGMRQQNTSTATGKYMPSKMGYFIGSTFNETKDNKLFSLMQTITSKYQRYTVADFSIFAGASVRCIKDAE